MIPIMYEWLETEFTSNGIGRLKDCISCKVTEERNGSYECEFQYPLTGEKYDLIQDGNIIMVSHDDGGDLQPFVIYRRSAPMRGVVTFNAHHISYRLTNTVLKPFTASGVVDALSKFETEVLTEQQFTFWTDKTADADFEVKTPSTAKSMLGGVAGSILDVYGGEYEFDKFAVKLHLHRGADNGVTIRYGKNMLNLRQDQDSLGLYNAVVPYWKNEEGVVVYGDLILGKGGFERTRPWTDEDEAEIENEDGTDFEFFYFQPVPYIMDMSQQFQEPPTKLELEAKAESILNRGEPWNPTESITVDFVALWQTEEYKNVAPLERVRLCDTVTIIYEELGVHATAKVNKTVWDVLTEKYTSVNLGATQASLSQTVSGSINDYVQNLPTVSQMDTAISTALNILSGQSGGNIAFLFDSVSRPVAFLIMDNADASKAANVLRFNASGVSLSQNGVSGQYRSVLRFSDGTLSTERFEHRSGLKWVRMDGGILSGGTGSSQTGAIDFSKDLGGKINVELSAVDEAAVTGDTVRLQPMTGGVQVYYNNAPQGSAVGSDDSREMATITKMNLIDREGSPSIIIEDADGELYEFSVTHISEIEPDEEEPDADT